jgi:hypothetical protein
MGFFSRNDDNSQLSDEQAVERYRYMLRTAPPDTLEQAHEEAFSRLSPEQRRLALQQLTMAASPEERRAATDDPKSLARLATRTEIRQPGMLERLFGSNRPAGSGGMGFGGMFAGSLLASLAGTFIASSIAHSFFDAHPFDESLSYGDDQAGVLTPEPELAQSSYEDSVPDADIDTGFDGGDFGDFS